MKKDIVRTVSYESFQDAFLSALEYQELPPVSLLDAVVRAGSIVVTVFVCDCGRLFSDHDAEPEF